MDSLRAPPPFLMAPGRPQISWTQCFREFLIFAVALSARCGFGELQEQFVGEQFLEGCSDPRLRERLCREPTLTSARILEVAEMLQMEAEREEPEELPSLSGFVHRVRLKSDQEVAPVQQRLRPLPYVLREEVRQHLEKLQQARIIEPVDSSPWISPIVVARRRNGQLRLCVDLKEVNKAVEASGHPLPDMQDLLEQLQGATVFSSLDLKSAHHQLELHPDSRSLTTFITHQGLMRYKRCLFGLKSLPQAFQKVMEAVLRGIDGVQVYLDDVIIFARTPSQHEVQLSAVMERLRRRRITPNMDKCRMRQREKEFLGFIISQRGGGAVNPARVQALRDLPPPSGLKDLQTMLGLFGSYSRFVPGYSTLVEPLRRLLRKGAPPFLWTPDLQAVMDTVRQGILKS
ncbi:uncharacterized protein K02A2.6-like [Pollicipes pollicipes]|uniref:uncharacterized protein K02A2.6-like n=1 Tax=Pollicipes pollicipes TaxID=41117 RepID=UPI00188534F5|nr:uncharacterized protein K02A2.6-like [Pollicipes pollicipes]